MRSSTLGSPSARAANSSFGDAARIIQKHIVLFGLAVRRAVAV